MSSYNIYRKKNDNSDDFWIWLSKVEKYVYKKVKMNLIDLPDEDYRIHFSQKNLLRIWVKLLLIN